MRIAVAYENESGQVYQHFGSTQKFKLYELDEGGIVSTSLVDTNGSGHSALASFLCGLGVDAVVCGGIGVGMQQALMEERVLIYGGVTGDADEAVKAFLGNRLEFSPDAVCADPNHEHADGSCGCGGHHHENGESGCCGGRHHEHAEGGCGCGHHHGQESGGCGCGHHAEG